MKKLTALLSVLLMILTVCPATAFANESIETDRAIEYLDDGSYIVTEITTSTITTFASKTTTQSKSSHHYNSDNTLNWTITITGTFSYNGSSATCESASTSYKIYNDNWKVTSAVPSKSGNKAIGTFTTKKYVLGVPVQTINRTVTLTCNANGVCS